MISTLTVLLLLAQHVNAFGSGAPEGACESLMPSHDAAPQQSPAPYQITTSQAFVARGDQISVTLSGADPFIGFFIRVQQDKQYIGGTFQENNFGSLRCNNQGMTHASAEPKQKLVLVWTAPDNIASSSIHFEATIVQKRPVFWTKVKSPDVNVSLVESINPSLNSETTTSSFTLANPNSQDPNTVLQPNRTSQNISDANSFPQQPNGITPGFQNPNTIPQPTPTNLGFQNPNGFPQANPTNPGFQNPNGFPQANPTNPGVQDANGFPQANPTNQGFQDPNGFPQANPTTPGFQNPNGFPQTNPTTQGFQDPNGFPQTNPTNPGVQDPNGFPQANPTNPGGQDPNGFPQANPTNPGFQNPNGFPQANPTSPGFQDPNGFPQANPTNQGFQDPSRFPQSGLVTPGSQDPNPFNQPNLNNPIPQDPNNPNPQPNPRNTVLQDPNTLPQPNSTNPLLQSPNAASLETSTAAADTAGPGFNGNDALGQPTTTISANAAGTEVIPGLNTTETVISGRPNSLAESGNGKLPLQ